MKSLTKKKAFLVPRLHEEDVYHLYYDVGSEEEDFLPLFLRPHNLGINKGGGQLVPSLSIL